MVVPANVIGNKPQNVPIVFRNKGLSRNSSATYSYAVIGYLRFLGRSDRRINPESVRDFLKVMRKDKRPSTYNLYRQALKEWLAGVFKDDHRQLFGVLELFKSTRRIATKHSVLRDEYLTREEVDEVTRKLLKGGTGAVSVALIVQALFWTGLRVSELLQIKLTEVKINGHVTIEVTGKGNKTHTVYLQLALYNRIRHHFQGKKYLFETRNHTPLNRKNVTRDIKKEFGKYGYHLSAHTFRHSKAMFLKDERCLSADQIQKALNHSTVKTTLESYFHGEPTAADMGLEGAWCI